MGPSEQGELSEQASKAQSAQAKQTKQRTQSKQSKVSKQVSLLKRKPSQLKPTQGKWVEHQKLNQTTPKASFGWVSGVQPRKPRKSTKQSKSK